MINDKFFFVSALKSAMFFLKFFCSMNLFVLHSVTQWCNHFYVGLLNNIVLNHKYLFLKNTTLILGHFVLVCIDYVRKRWHRSIIDIWASLAEIYWLFCPALSVSFSFSNGKLEAQTVLVIRKLCREAWWKFMGTKKIKMEACIGHI